MVGVANPTAIGMSDDEGPDVFPLEPLPTADNLIVGGPFAFLNADDRGGSGGTKTSYLPGTAATQITRNSSGWAGVGNPATVTYAFRETAPATMPTDTASFTQFSSVQINATLLALAAWSDVANITFTRVDGGAGYSNNATILFGNYGTGQSGAAAFAYGPGSTSTTSNAGDVWINSSIANNQNPVYLLYGQHTLLHEIGHAIGLSHPAAYNASEGETITYSNNAIYYEDSRQYTVMSYFSESNTGGSFGGRYASAPLMDDIAAAQRLYGANMTTRTGDTTYGFNSNAGHIWYSAVGAASVLIFSVWDAGGTDTFDFSGYGNAQTIDLRQGSFSSVGGLIGNVSIAIGAVIENAVGGSGNDVFYGNSGDNRLTLNGGSDTVDGGLGNDTVVFLGARSEYNITISNQTVSVSRIGSGTAEYVSLRNVEFLAFSDQTVAAPSVASNGLTLSGDYLANVFSGSAAADVLDGGGGDDRISAGGGNDRIVGGWGNDVLYGEDGDDTLVGGLGSDTLDGGNGVDLADYSTISGSLQIDLTIGVASSASGNDTLVSIESVTGGSSADVMVGNAASNVLRGGGGADVLRGLAGDDTLVAGAPGLAGGAPDVVKAATQANATLQTAVNLDGAFDLMARDGVANATTIPHATVTATTHGGLEYYAFTVAAGDQVVFDIDNAQFDSTLRIFNASGVELAKNDDGGSDNGGTDSGLTYTFTTGGTYYVQVADWTANLTGGDFTSAAPAAGLTYTLHISIPGHSAVAAVETGTQLDGGDGNDTLQGGSGGDYMLGGAGADVLIGGAGADLMIGGAGADIFRFTHMSESISTPSQGSDIIDDFETGIDKIDFANMGVQSLTITSAGEYNLVTMVQQGSGSGVTPLTIRVRGAISQSDFILAGTPPAGQIITGTSAAETLVGGEGDDVIIGLGGGDALAGGTGRDTFQYNAASDSNPAGYDNLYDFETRVDVVDLTALSTTAISIIRTGMGSASASYLFADTTSGPFQLVAAGRIINGADIRYGGTHGIFMVGSDAMEEFIGGSRNDGILAGGANDILTGGAGADALGGGAGVDEFRYQAASDSNATGGYDNLFDFETGSDRIVFNFATTEISLIRSGGSTFLFGRSPEGEFMLVGAGREINARDLSLTTPHGIYLIGSADNDVLVGSNLGDPIEGGAGNDRITGGGGADALFGNEGADTFIYVAASDSTLSLSDRIFGFVSGQDRVDLSAVRRGASDAYGLAYSGGGTFLFIDLGGDGTNDMLIQFAGATVTASDIIWTAPVSAPESQTDVPGSAPETFLRADPGFSVPGDGERPLYIFPESGDYGWGRDAFF